MIALRNSLPLVRFHDGQVMNFEREWLETALVRAAQTAGYKKWWLADHVTESVTSYLKQDFDESVVTIARLEKAVQSVLRVIGYEDVADCFQTMPPPFRLSLEDIVREAGSGYEMAFFEILRRRLREAIEPPTLQVELTGLHRSVKMLRSAKHWSSECTDLLGEIVSFVRGEVEMCSKTNELSLQLT